MENTMVKDLMVPLSEYATVPETASLKEAVVALEEIQDERFGRIPHRAVLVMNDQKRIVGKVSQWDIVRSLEPRYKEIGEFHQLSRFGFSVDFIENMQKTYNLWQKSPKNIIDITSNTCVADIMYTPSEDEYVAEDSSLQVAIHQMVVGHHQSLLVIRNGRVVGVLRFSDVFAEVSKLIRD